MNRLKFLVFALIALGLFGWSLTLAPSLGADRAAQDASLSLTGVAPSVALALEGQRSQLQAVALKLGGSTALANPGPKAATPTAPTPERFSAVRAAATDGLADAAAKSLVVVVGNEAGVLVAQGAGEAGPAPEGFDVAAVGLAGGSGAVVAAFGAPHLFYALPLVVSDKNEVKQAGFAAVGLPVLPDTKALLSKLRSDLRLQTIAMVADGKPVALEGNKAAVEALVKSLKPGPASPINEGSVEVIGPLALPLMSSLTQELGVRRAIEGTPYEVIATVSSAEDLIALAGFQKFGLGSLAGLLLLSIAVVALIKSGEEEGAAMVLPPPMPAPPVRTLSEPPGPVAVPEAPEAAPQEASPDDFDFPASASTSAPPMPVARPATAQVPAHQPAPFDAEPASDPFANLAPAPAPQQSAPAFPASPKPPPPVTSQQPVFQPPPPAPAPAAPPPSRTQPASNPFDDEEGARTMAYPVFKPPAGGAPSAPPPGMDPFAMAAAQLSPEEQAGGDGDYNPDATRVAAVPAELIKAARQAGSSGMTGERPALSSRVTSSAPRVSSVSPAGGPLDEERHFQEVFREFVATREKCGEPADGLTYDKFKTKLLKNKEQLVQKYACKSVRFQVYVKDGKAALKATPVKD
ncbi:MAG: MXAN_5187 family protein [Myxococcaceae bacterium]|nr:MXAN_5187 family protein [Myxococcaceae bacterium]